MNKPRRIEHFPKMKVRGNNGRIRELEWSIDQLRKAAMDFTRRFYGAEHHVPGPAYTRSQL